MSVPVPTETGKHPDCKSVAEPNRKISTVTLTVTYSGTASISGDDISGTLDISGTFSRTWTRVPLGAINSGDPPDAAFNRPAPGIDNFNLIDFGCACCRCRIGWVFDDALPPTSPDLDVGGEADVIVTVSMTADVTPPIDSTTEDIVASGGFWSSQAPPCKIQDGPRLHGAPDLVLATLAPLPDLPLPFEYQSPSDPDNQLTLSVSGTNSPVAGFVGSGIVTFMDVHPCQDNDSFTYGANYANTFTDADMNTQSVSLGVTYALAYF